MLPNLGLTFPQYGFNSFFQQSKNLFILLQYRVSIYNMSDFRQKRAQQSRIERKIARLTTIAKKRGQDVPSIIHNDEQQDPYIQQVQIKINQITKQQGEDEQETQIQAAQQQDVVQKIAQLQKSIKKMEKTLQNPKAVYDDVKNKQPEIQLKQQIQKKQLVFNTEQELLHKQQTLQNNQQPDHYFQDTGIAFSRRNYRQIVRQLMSNLEDLNYDIRPFNKYKSMHKSTKKQKRLYSTQQLQARLKIMYSKYKLLHQYHPQIQAKMFNIQNQLQALQNYPKAWLKQYMKKKLKLSQNDKLYKDMLGNKLVVQRQIQNRKQILYKYKSQIMQHPEKYAKRTMKKRLNKVQKLQQLMDIKTKMYQQQKSSLVFLIDTATQEVNKLQKQIVQTKNQYEKQLQKMQKENKEKIQQMNTKQIQLKGKVNDMANFIQQQANIIQNQKNQIQQQQKQIEQSQLILTKDQEKIRQLTLQNIKLRQELQISRQKEHKILQEAYKQFQRLKEENMSELNKLKDNFKQNHMQNINQKQKLINQKIKQKQRYQNQLQVLQSNHMMSMQNIKMQMDYALNNFKNQTQYQFQQRIRGMKQQYIVQNNRIMAYMEGRQRQFRQYQQKKADQINQLTAQYMKQLEQLMKSQQNQNKTKQQQFDLKKTQLQNKIKLSKQKSQKQTQMIRRVLNENKQESQKLINSLKEEKKQYEDKLKRKDKQLQQLRKQKQNYIKQLQMKLDKQIKQKEQQKLKKQKAQREREQAIREAETIKKSMIQMQQLLKKYTQNKTFITAFKRWEINDEITIRQCFKQNQDKQWIATTRGINYSKKAIPSILSIFKYWDEIYKNKTFPLTQKKQKIKGTNLLMILDVYKGKRYYSLRQFYYYNNTQQPTRRGFNISEDDLESFFVSISQSLKISQIANKPQKQVIFP